MGHGGTVSKVLEHWDGYLGAEDVFQQQLISLYSLPQFTPGTLTELGGQDADH